MSREIRIVLAGNPNSGKTTLFNALTGLNQKISNLPGTTVDKKTGQFQIGEDKCVLYDFPGTYSLYPKGEDERISVRYLLSNENKKDVILYVADAGNLKRNLLLYSQIADLGIPMVLALSMTDMAEKKGIQTDVRKLSEELGVIVCPVDARHERGLDKLKDALLKASQPVHRTFFSNLKCFTGSGAASYQTVLLNRISEKETDTASDIADLTAASETVERYRIIDNILEQCVLKALKRKSDFTQRMDAILMHPVYGFIIFYAFLFVLFQTIFRIADYPMQWIETGFSMFSAWSADMIPEGMMNSLVSDGIIPGVGGVLVFLPQIIFLFAFIAVLEDSGYMTRISFMTDRMMRAFGLTGRSVVPLIGGMACAIPSIMAARNIENKKDRLITILVTPLMSCSARLPVYTLLIGMLSPQVKYGWLDVRGLMLFGMYLLGFVSALFFAFIFKLFIRQKEGNFFILEMPDYRMPQLKNIILTIREKAGDFVFNAGKVILIVSIVLWFMASFGPPQTFENIEKRYQTYTHSDKEEKIKSEKLEASFAGILGRTIEPAISPLGYDWKIGIALITSFAAREVFVGTLSTIYNVGNESEEETMREVLSGQKNPKTGQQVFSTATILSLLVFYAFAMQCISTLAVTYRETRSKIWPAVQLVYMSGFAWLMSYLTYTLFN